MRRVQCGSRFLLRRAWRAQVPCAQGLRRASTDHAASGSATLRGAGVWREVLRVPTPVAVVAVAAGAYALWFFFGAGDGTTGATVGDGASAVAFPAAGIDAVVIPAGWKATALSEITRPPAGVRGIVFMPPRLPPVSPDMSEEESAAAAAALATFDRSAPPPLLCVLRQDGLTAGAGLSALPAGSPVPTTSTVWQLSQSLLVSQGVLRPDSARAPTLRQRTVSTLGPFAHVQDARQTLRVRPRPVDAGEGATAAVAADAPVLRSMQALTLHGVLPGGVGAVLQLSGTAAAVKEQQPALATVARSLRFTGSGPPATQ